MYAATLLSAGHQSCPHPVVHLLSMTTGHSIHIAEWWQGRGTRLTQQHVMTMQLTAAFHWLPSASARVGWATSLPGVSSFFIQTNRVEMKIIHTAWEGTY